MSAYAAIMIIKNSILKPGKSAFGLPKVDLTSLVESNMKKVLKERLGDTVSADISAEDIINRVADLTNVRADDIVGLSRRKEIAEARQLSVYLCRELLGLSLATIGMHFGGRDHTTALYACKKVKTTLKTDKRFNRIVGTVKDDLSFAIL